MYVYMYGPQQGKGISMPYIDPRMVLSPKGRVDNLRVIHDGKEGSFAVAKMNWDGNPAVGVRWNGGDTGKFEGLGNPQSRGIATWFILPDPIAKLVEENLPALCTSKT
jgi:hypothetical protein